MPLIEKVINTAEYIRNNLTSFNDTARLGYICSQHGSGKQAISAGYQEIENKRQALLDNGVDEKYALNAAICAVSEKYGYTPTVPA